MSNSHKEAAGLAEHNVLLGNRIMGPMPWILAILMFMTILAAAVGLSLGLSAYRLSSDVEHRLTVQIIEANADIRQSQSLSVIKYVTGIHGIDSATLVDDDQLGKLVAPWLGNDGAEAGLPYPSLIDVVLQPDAQMNAKALEQELRNIAPSVHIEPDSQWLRPLVRLLTVVSWLAFSIVLLMMVALAAAVMLSARASLNTHRATIDILHLIGSSDGQIARLFQRRIVLDALASGAIGFVGAIIVLALFQLLVGQMDSEFFGASVLPLWGWPLLVALPAFGTFLANFAARVTVLRALKQIL